MFPLQMVDDLKDIHPVKAVPSGYLSLGSLSLGVDPSDLQDVFLLEAGVVVTFSPLRVLGGMIPIPAFSNAVKGIVGVGPKKEMVWTDTRAVVAFMADEKTVGNESEVGYPRNPMGLVAYLVNTDPTVPFGSAPSPYPAFDRVAGDMHLGPEPVNGLLWEHLKHEFIVHNPTLHVKLLSRR